ncbi:MAG: NADH-quinone oxidoreductase subunit J [Bacteroidetes bacterium]|nr:NADH-quinone oxidoreductase subunit J [Bacteroidota bacterium]
MTVYLFYLLSFIAIISALMVVISKNPVYSVLFLIMTFFAIAGHYVLLNAQFLAAVHVIVYAGAIMVLFLYVIMMMNFNKEAEPSKTVFSQIIATIAGGILLITLVGAIRIYDIEFAISTNATSIGLISNLGKVLFSKFLLPFEISSLLFLAAMTGVVLLGKNNTHS